MLLRQASDERFQINALDGLRGIAVFIVICSHTSNAGWFFLPMLDLRGIGKSGVYLFFLLSAFLLTLPLLHQGKKIISLPVLRTYFQRRFFRIYPIYCLYLLFAALSTLVIHHYLGNEHNGIPFSLNTTEFIQQLLLIDCKGVTWSIAAEFKFYFVLPVLALAIYSLRQYHLALAIVVPGIFLIILHMIMPYSPFLANYQNCWLYMPIFITGMLLALIQKDIGVNNLSRPVICLSYMLAILGLVAIFSMTPLAMKLLGKNIEKEYFHEYYFSYGLAWAPILFAAVNTKGFIQKLLCSRILRFFGAISFSLYLFHPIPIFLLLLFNINTPFNAWIVLIFASCLAWLSSRYLELPLSKIRF